MRRQSFGNTPDGRAVELYTFGAPGFIEISVMTYGATLQRILAPSRKGERTNVVLGFDTVEGYTANDGHYFGATIGRTANRISGGRFTLDGRKHQVAPKDGVDALHGGSRGFDKHVWQVTSVNERRITLRLVSPHGD